MIEVVGDLHCPACGYDADVPMEAWDECEVQKDARIAALEADLKDTVRRREHAEAELAALRARRCETCGRLPGGCCINEALEIFSESPTPYCSRWTARSTL